VRQLADREQLNVLWAQLVALRQRMAANAQHSDYRAFRWEQMLRFDYTPADCVAFQNTIEEVAVPAAARIYERRRQRLDIDTLRPWDLAVDTLGRPPLRPFTDVAELERKAAAIFRRVDPQLSAYFETMRRESLLDLANHKGKAPGGYCTIFPLARRPFIFMNAVGLEQDVVVLLHEAGHSFHAFELLRLPYHQQWEVGMEFAEVGSMAMELLAAPYLRKNEGGFYSDSEAARARVDHLERIICFWPYMAVVDAFQHWVYVNPDAAADPVNCDAQWGELWHRFMRGVNWSGFEQEMVTGWQRKLHIFKAPFYYVEYGLAQLGAVQVWRNSLRNQSDAVSRYREALSLGCTMPLPQLYEAAGATFAFDAATLRDAVMLIERTIDELDSVQARSY